MVQPRDPALAEAGGQGDPRKMHVGHGKARSHLARYPACAGSYLEPGDTMQDDPVELRGSVSETKAVCQQQESHSVALAQLCSGHWLQPLHSAEI